MYFDISIYDVLFDDFQKKVAKKGRMHKNTSCTVFSALNKMCCILLWTLHILFVHFVDYLQPEPWQRYTVTIIWGTHKIAKRTIDHELQNLATKKIYFLYEFC